MRLIHILFEIILPCIICGVNHFAGYVLYHEVVFVKVKDMQVSPTQQIKQLQKIYRASTQANNLCLYPQALHVLLLLSLSKFHLNVLSTVICYVEPSLHGNFIQKMMGFAPIKQRFYIDNYTGILLFKLCLVNSSPLTIISESASKHINFTCAQWKVYHFNRF